MLLSSFMSHYVMKASGNLEIKTLSLVCRILLFSFFASFYSSTTIENLLCIVIRTVHCGSLSEKRS